MADLSITAASVLAGKSANKETGVAAEAVAAGKAVYKSETTGEFGLADSNSSDDYKRRAYGVALHAAATGQPLTVAKSGPVTIGATLTPGVAYYLSDTPGGICPVADVGSGEYVCLIGLARDAAIIDVDVKFPGVAN